MVQLPIAQSQKMGCRRIIWSLLGLALILLHSVGGASNRQAFLPFSNPNLLVDQRCESCSQKQGIFLVSVYGLLAPFCCNKIAATFLAIPYDLNFFRATFWILTFCMMSWENHLIVSVGWCRTFRKKLAEFLGELPIDLGLAKFVRFFGVVVNWFGTRNNKTNPGLVVVGMLKKACGW